MFRFERNDKDLENGKRSKGHMEDLSEDSRKTHEEKELEMKI